MQRSELVRDAIFDRHADEQESVDGAPAEEIHQRLMRRLRTQIAEKKVDIVITEAKSDTFKKFGMERHRERRYRHGEGLRGLLGKRLRRSVRPEFQFLDGLQNTNSRWLRNV
jgi:hypothetical protein